MQKLSNEAWYLIRQYETQLNTLEAFIAGNLEHLRTVAQDQELLYLRTHFQNLLENIRHQKTWCKAIYGL